MMNLEVLFANKRMIVQLFEGELRKKHPFKYVWSIFQNYEIIPNCFGETSADVCTIIFKEGDILCPNDFSSLHAVSKPLAHLGNFT